MKLAREIAIRLAMLAGFSGVAWLLLAVLWAKEWHR